MWRAVGVLVVAALVLASSTAPTYLFYDEFDRLDLRVWKPKVTMDGGGNGEFEVYLNNRTNAYVRNSVLYIRPTLLSDALGEGNIEAGFTMDLWGEDVNVGCTSNWNGGCVKSSQSAGLILPPIQSASLRTIDSMSFRYGTMETRAKLPRGQWLWPAIWLLPKWGQYGGWPASGEIDIMEARGNLGVKEFGSTLHWGPMGGQDPWWKTHQDFQLPNGGSLADDFYVYGLSWNSTGIETYIYGDNLAKHTVLDVSFADIQSFWDLGGWESTYSNPWAGNEPWAPFDQEFYIILNVAVGGTGGYWSDGYDNKPWNNSDPLAMNAFWKARNEWYLTWNGEDAALQIDWIKVWQ
eukprot:ANDGO_01726.mRNA.1 Beta-1